MEGIIDLMPLLDVAFELVVIAVGTFGVWALNSLKNKFNIEVNDQHDKKLTEAIEYGFGYAMNRFADNNKSLTIKTEREFIAEVANYVIKGVPKAIRELGLTEERIEELVRARLAGKIPKDEEEFENN